MRIVVDALCAQFGGIRTYVEHLLEAWAATHPDDELHVVTSASLSLPTFGHVEHVVSIPSPRFMGRPWAQTRHLDRIARAVDADVVIATAPTTSVRRLSVPLAVTILDLRHELRPEQFSAWTRLLRRVSYGRTYQLADVFLAISQRSLDDLHDLHPATRETPAVVTYLGGDHVLGWAPLGGGRDGGPAIAFAHHTNKNPELILDGWAELVARGAGRRLTLLGVGARRAALQELIDARDLGAWIELAPFLDEDEFRGVLAGAAMVVFPSDFEGFGLPVVEGMLLGHPVVIGPEKATREIAGGHAFEMTDWSPAALADAVVAAAEQTAAARDAALAHAESFTWARTVSQTRSALAAALTQR